MVKNLSKKFFSLDNTVNPAEVLGDIPSTAQIYKTVLSIAIPAIMDMVLISVISVIDTMMVASIGDAATAAVGLTAQPRLIILSAFVAVGTGVTAFVSRRKGENNSILASTALTQILVLALIASIICAILGGVYSRDIMQFMGAETDYINYASTYFKIIMLGIPFNVMTFFINSAQRGCGNTKISMVVNIVANVVNIVFNFLLIGGNLGFPKLGVAGAAISTILGNIISFIVAFVIMLRGNGFLQLKFGYLKNIDTKLLEPVFRVGLASGVEQVFFRVGFLITSKIIASLGTQAMAANTASTSIQQLIFSFCDGISMASASLFGQALGQNRPDLSTIYYRACRKISLFMVLILSSSLIVLSRPVMMLFSRDPYIIDIGSKLLFIVAIVAPLQAMQYVTASCLRTAGDAKYTARVTMGSVGILRPALAYIMCYPMGLGIIGSWLSYLFDQIVRYTLCQKRFLSGIWKNIKL